MSGKERGYPKRQFVIVRASLVIVGIEVLPVK
jgi:hypothetical protein